MPIDSEQRALITEALDSSEELLLLAAASEDGVAVIVRPIYPHPAAFGLLLADLVEHVANAYTREGFDPTSVRNEILNALGGALDFPTGCPVSIQTSMEDVPHG